MKYAIWPPFLHHCALVCDVVSGVVDVGEVESSILCCFVVLQTDERIFSRSPRLEVELNIFLQVDWSKL